MHQGELKISLGCGRTEKPGFVGLDNVDFGWNKKWNAGDEIPFNDNSADFIEMHNFLEHIPREKWILLLNECWRVLKPTGILEIISPDAVASIDLAISDPTHMSLISKGMFRYFTGERPRNADYGIKRWLLEVGSPNNMEKEPRVLLARMRPNK